MIKTSRQESGFPSSLSASTSPITCGAAAPATFPIELTRPKTIDENCPAISAVTGFNPIACKMLFKLYVALKMSKTFSYAYLKLN